jgi:hypothetical protein
MQTLNRADRRAAAKAKPVKHRKGYRASNPIEGVVFKMRIAKDVERLRTGAGLHAFMGADAEALCNLTGRLIYITAFAVGKQYGEATDNPDARILLGAASALGDLMDHPKDLERHRGAIQSGLAAIDRLMPDLSEWALAEGALRLDQLLKSTEGLTTGHVRDALKVAY